MNDSSSRAAVDAFGNPKRLGNRPAYTKGWQYIRTGSPARVQTIVKREHKQMLADAGAQPTEPCQPVAKVGSGVRWTCLPTNWFERSHKFTPRRRQREVCCPGIQRRVITFGSLFACRYRNQAPTLMQLVFSDIARCSVT